MKSLILHPNVTAQWHALVYEGQRSCEIYLEEELEAYLVFLLMRFTTEPTLSACVLGLDFLHTATHSLSSHQSQALKEVGDKCLLTAGLFPGRASRRRVKISYYVKLGQSAYSTLAIRAGSQEKLFIRLSMQFPRLMDVLYSMRQTASGIDLLHALELWHDTGSVVAWRRAQEITLSLPLPLSNATAKH